MGRAHPIMLSFPAVRGRRHGRHTATSVGLLGAALLLYVLSSEGVGPWLGALHVAASILVLWRRFWVRWLVLGLAGGDLLLGVSYVLWGDTPTPGALLILVAAWSLAVIRLCYGDTVARGYDGQGAWAHRLRLTSSTVESTKRSFIAMGFATPLLVELVARRLPEARQPELAWSAIVLILLGGFGLLRQRTWSLSALSSAAALLAVFALSSQSAHAVLVSSSVAVALGLAVGRFLRPICRALFDASFEHE